MTFASIMKEYRRMGLDVVYGKMNPVKVRVRLKHLRAKKKGQGYTRNCVGQSKTRRKMARASRRRNRQ